MKTLKEAKDFLRANYKNGCECPACGQYVREYRRKLNSGMALFLIGLYKLTMKEPIKKGRAVGMSTVAEHLKFYSNKEVFEIMSLKVTSLDYSVMKHFGLIEPRISENGKRDSGYWRITYFGTLFVLGKEPRPKYVFLYNNKRQGVSDEQITIREALGEKFDYEELMKAK